MLSDYAIKPSLYFIFRFILKFYLIGYTIKVYHNPNIALLLFDLNLKSKIFQENQIELPLY